MTVFNLADLSEWQPQWGGYYALPATPDAPRKVSFDVLSDVEVAAYIYTPIFGEHETTEGPLLCVAGRGSGMWSVRMTVTQPVLVRLAQVDTSLDLGSRPMAWLRRNDQTQVIPESTEESLTVIEPRPTGAAEEVRRMMYMMSLNQQARDEALRAEFEAKYALLDNDGDGIPNGTDPTPDGEPTGDGAPDDGAL